MKSRPPLLLSAFFLLMAACRAEPSPSGEAGSARHQGAGEGADKPPVLFLANYMDSFNPVNAKASEQDLGIDVYPFNRRAHDDLLTRESEVRSMLIYGMDGMQVWPNFRRAALWLDALPKMNVDRPFYVTPQIAGVADQFFATYEDFVTEAAEFLKSYGDHPHMLKINGLPVLSTWGTVAGYTDDAEQFRKDVRLAGGGEFFLLPTVELSVHDPDLRRLRGLGARTDDAFSAWRNLRDATQIQKIAEAFTAGGKDPILAGGMWPGYCNNNRMFNDNYRLFFGAGELLHSLEAGLEAGLPIMILPTWNDVHESASYPSWKNIFGTGTLTAYYRSVYEFGHGPDRETRVVLGYLQDMLLGDLWNFGVVLLPGYEDSLNETWLATLRLEDVYGNEVAFREIEIAPETRNRAQLVDFPIALPELEIPVFSPILTIDGVTRRLPPVVVRHGRSRTTYPTLVSWDWLSEAQVKTSPSDSVITEHKALFFKAEVHARQPITDILLSDIGDVLFDLSAGQDAGEWGITLAIDNLTGHRVPLKLSLDKGGFDNVHYRGSWDDNRSRAGQKRLQTVDLNLPASARGYRPDAPVVVLSVTSLDREAGLKINLREQTFETTLGELAVHPVVLAAGKGHIRIRAAETGHARLRAPQLGLESVGFRTLLPNAPHGEKFRVLTVQGRLDNGKVFFSKPQVWIRQGDLANKQRVAIVESGLWQDQDVDEPRLRQVARTYPASKVRQALLADPFIPEYLYPFDEGWGWYVSDAGVYSSRGWGWRTAAGTRKVPWNPPLARDPQWESDNVIAGTAMRFGPQSRLGIRSNSGFSGTFTWAAWVFLEDASKGGRLFSDGDQMALQVLPGGQLSGTRGTGQSRDQVISREAMQEGHWHHVSFTYDLQHLRLFLDGQLVAESPADTHLLRTRSLPWFGASSPDNRDGFTGIMDEAIFSSRALTVEEIAALAGNQALPAPLVPPEPPPAPPF